VETLLSLGLHNALAATALAVLVAALGLFCRRPALVHGLWLLVLLKLLLPPLGAVALPWPVWPEALLGVGENASLRGETPVALDPAVRLPADAGVPLVPAAPTSRPDLPPPAAGPSWRLPVAVAWLTGSLLWAGMAGWRVIRFQRLLRYTELAPAPVQEQARRLANRLGLARCPGVWLVPAPVSPLLWALGTPRLLVPVALWERLTEAQRETLLVHELAHLRRRDHWVRGLELAVTALYWWHPVVWWARRQLREAEEQCCDAWVVWALPGAAPAYATALLAAVTFLSQSRPALPVAASGIGHVDRLKRRLTMILQGTCSRALGWAGVLVVLGLGFLFLPWVPTLAQPGEAPNTWLDEEKVSPPAGAEIAFTLQAPGWQQAAPGRAGPDPALAEEAERARDQMELLEVDLQVKRAQLKAVILSLERARNRLRLVEALHQRKGISQEEFEQAKHEVAAMEAELHVKEAQLQEPEVRLRQARRRYERLEQARQQRPAVRPDPTVRFPPQETRPASAAPDEQTRLRQLERKLDSLLKEVEAIRRELRPLRSPTRNETSR
jgi:beta-lactamase regulating signal transducer with metallopeptidase domain